MTSPKRKKKTGSNVNVENGKYAAIFKRQGLKVQDPGTANLARLDKEFSCKPVSFAGYVRNAAAKYGLKVTISVIGGEVIYAYYEPGALMKPNLQNYPVVRKIRRAHRDVPPPAED